MPLALKVFEQLSKLLGSHGGIKMVIEFVKLGDTFMPRLLLKLLIGFKPHEVFLGYEKLLMNAEERYFPYTTTSSCCNLSSLMKHQVNV